MATPQAFKASCDEIFGASKSIHVSGATPSSQTNSISSGIYNQVKFNYFIINYYYMAYFVQKIKNKHTSVVGGANLANGGIIG